MTELRKQVPRVSYLVKWVERGLRIRMDAALAPFGLTTPEYTALSVLRQRDGISSAQLARRTMVTAQAMNLVVISLEQRGLIRRTTDPNHARIQRTSVTTKGIRLLQACDEVTLAVEAQMLGSLSRAEIAALRRALSSCVASLDEQESDTERPVSKRGDTGKEK